MGGLPLHGVTILDFFWMIAGPLGTKALLELGARVIKVESESRPDNMRILGPYPDGFEDINHPGGLHSVNSCKESIAVNMKLKAGRELIRSLLPHVDVVTNNYTPEKMAQWGLSFEEVAAINPRIVYLSMPAMGRFGPRKDWRAYGHQLSAIAGLNAITGFEGDPPSGPNVIYPDYSGNPFHAAAAIIAGLEFVRRAGRAVEIDVSQYESTAALIGQHVLAETLSAGPGVRLGNRHPWQTPHGVFPSAGFDRWIAISVATDAQWEGLCQVLALEPPCEWQTFLGRKRDEDRVEQAIADRTARRDGYELMAELQRARVPAGVVQTIEDLVQRDPYMAEQFFRRFTKDGVEYRISAPAFHIAGSEPPVGLLSDLGADTDTVLSELARLDAGGIAALRNENVLA